MFWRMAIAAAMLLLSWETVSATVHEVGDSAHWTLPTSSNNVNYGLWAESTEFFLGDKLHFTYGRQLHTVQAMRDSASFESCDVKTAQPNLLYADGNTTIDLDTIGTHWYICTIPGHCAKGMKLKVHVKKHPSPAQ